jgi:hypothetical protein
MLSRMRIWILAPLVWAIFLAGMWSLTALSDARGTAACRTHGEAGSAAICPPSAYK